MNGTILKFSNNTRGNGKTSNVVEAGGKSYVFNISQRRVDELFYINQQIWCASNITNMNPTGYKERKLIHLGLFKTCDDAIKRVNDFVKLGCE